MELKQQLKKNEAEQREKEQSLKDTQTMAEKFAGQVQEAERREQELTQLVELKDVELEEKEQEVQRLRLQVADLKLEVQELNSKALKLKDRFMDFDASVDKHRDRERQFLEEISSLKDQLLGKDQAIKALGQNLLEKGREHELMSEKFNVFKNKLISENCFHTQYAARKIEGRGLLSPKVSEVTIGFMRDPTFEEEFFLVVESKEFSPLTGSRQRKLIAIDDVLEIEHTQNFEFRIAFCEEPD
jgi:predicted RNase H-like nuclease (RuvC/YqgF family)